MDGPDCPDGNAVCKHPHTRSDDQISDTDVIIGWQYRDSTTTDEDEEVMQELSATDIEYELLEEQQQPVVFKVPEKEAPRKTRRSRKERSTTATKATRRPKVRACKSTTKNYDVEFSDDAEVN